MKKTKYYLFLATIFIMLLSVAGCALPGFSISINNSPSASTPQSTPTEAPSPINPSFQSPPLATGNPEAQLPNFVSVIAAVKPSVVAINTKTPAMDIFGSSITQEGAGSGWIIDSTPSSALIVTNNHVVAGANSITATLEDGRNFPAVTVRTDPVSDLAVIKIDGSNLPPALKVGDSSKLQVGDWVVAIGNSLGQGISATQGIVSVLGVSSVTANNDETLYDLIQTNAAINPGNSGGPLVDLASQVIGIDSIKVAQVGVEGMGYAISTKEAMPIIDDLIHTGYVIRPWMGVGLYTVDPTVVFRYGLAVNQGVLITQVAAGSPASKAGLKPGDVIIAIDGKNVVSVADLTQIIHTDKVGQHINLTFYRGKVKSTTSLTLAKSPPPGSS